MAAGWTNLRLLFNQAPYFSMHWDAVCLYSLLQSFGISSECLLFFLHPTLNIVKLSFTICIVSILMQNQSTIAQLLIINCASIVFYHAATFFVWSITLFCRLVFFSISFYWLFAIIYFDWKIDRMLQCHICSPIGIDDL